MRRVLTLALVVFVIGSVTVTGITSFAGIAAAAANSATVTTTDVSAGTPVEVTVGDDATTADPGYTAIASVDGTYDADGTDVSGSNATADATAVDIDTSGGDTGDYTVYVANTTSTPADGTDLSAWANVTADQTLHIDGSTAANFSVAIDSTNAPVDAGDTLTVEATVENVGDLDGETPVDLAVDGTAVDGVTVSLGGGETKTVTLTDDVPAANETGSFVATVSTANDSVARTINVNGNETLSGTLTDGATGEALSGLNVTIVDDGSTRTVQTDENGTYSATVLNGSAITVSATTTVGNENTLEITATNATTVDGATTLDLALHPELPGSGTENDPYEISNARELQAMNQDLSANYTLVSNVNASGTESWNGGDGFMPVGKYLDSFIGSFNGSDHTISELYINQGGEPEVGLFGYTSGAVIQQVGLEEAFINGSADVGALIGHAAEDSTVSESYATGTVHGIVKVGGLVGVNQNSDILESYATTTVDGTQVIGGLVGRNGRGSSEVTRSYAAGDVDGSMAYVGGLVGTNEDESIVSESYATGDVDGTDYVGGLVGSNFNADVEVTESYATGDVSGDNHVGGVAGENIGTVEDVYWDVTTTGQTDSAGNTTGLTTVQMTGPNATEYMDGLDYEIAWLALDDESPVLSWQVDSYDLSLADELDVGDTTDATVGVTLADGTQTTATETSTYTAEGSNVSVDGSTVTVDTYGTDTVTATAGGLSDAAEITALDSDFNVSLDEPPSSVNAGESYEFEVTVENIGNAEGTKNVSLAFNGTEFYNESETLAAGGTATIAVDYEISEDAATVASVDLRATTPDDEATAQVQVNGYETVSGTVTDGATGEALAGVDVTVDGAVADTTNASGQYSVEIHDGSAVDIGATTSVDGAEETVELTNTTGVTVDGTTTFDLALYPELAGSGTETNPYLIGNARELQAMNQDLSGHYVLVDDVNASGTAAWNDGRGFEPVGTTDSISIGEVSTLFDGSFDGRNRSISGLTINSDEAFIGLFGAATDASIQNVSLEKLDITGSSSETDAIGGVVGLSGSLTVTSVDVSGSVRRGSRLGGLIGRAPARQNSEELTLSDVRSDVTVKSGTDDSGGVVGYWNTPATIDNIITTGDVVSSGDSSGGFAGYLTDAQVTNVSSTGNVSVTSGESIEYAGGLIGEAGTTIIDHASATGDVRAGDGGISNAGGLVGGSVRNITESSATGDITGTDTVGGLAGGNADNIVGSYATGALDGNNVGGLVGRAIDYTNKSVYWNESTADKAVNYGDATGTTGLTPDEMTGPDAVNNMDGLDYENTWLALDDESPALSWQVDSYDLTLADDDIDVGDSTDVTVGVTLADGTQTTATTTSNFTASGNVSIAADGTVTAADTYGPGTVTASASAFSDDATVTALGSDFRVELTDAPANVDAGETYRFEATVENIGNAEGTKNVSLAFNGTEFYNESSTVGPDTTETITAEYTIPADADSGTVDLNASTPGDNATAPVHVNGYQAISGMLTNGVTGEVLSGVDVRVDGAVLDTTNASGYYEAQVHDNATVEVGATATVAGAEGDVELTATNETTVDGATTANLTLWPELAGEGTEAKPYEIGNAYELQAMNQNLDANYTLASDVNASGTAAWNDGKGFDPIADSLTASFTGTLDGDGHTITGMTIDRPAESNVGLFGFMNGHVSNATIRDATVTGDKWVGGLVSDLYGSVTEVSVSANVSGTDDVGGLVGYLSGTVDKSAVSGNVSGTIDVGGLVGAGGSAAVVTDSHAASTVSGTEEVGGLVGSLATSATVEHSLATGEVSGVSQVGGLIGSASSYSTVTDAYWDVDTTGQSDSSGDGTGLTTTEMTGADATEHMALDFDATWAPTTGYPHLRWNDDRAEPFFAVTSIDVPATVAPNRTLAANATIENVGAADGAKDVTLSFDGTALATKSVTVDAGANETVSIAGPVPAGTSPGDYEVAITSPAGGASSAPVEVKTLSTVSGTATDAISGDALDDETVTVQYASGSTETAQTDASGAYSIEVFDGSEVTVSANVTADAIESPRINDSATVTVDSDETVALELWPELDGDGTEASPYEISNAYELQAIHQDGSANYTLVSDVDASGTESWNDGAGFDTLPLAGGTVDGRSHSIENLTIDADNSRAYTGLFDAVWGGSHVSNLSLVNATATDSTAGFTGLLAGSLTDSTVENVSVSGRTSAGDGSLGGLVGTNFGTIRNSTADVTVEGNATDVGGFVGVNKGTVSTSFAVGSVEGGTTTGGLVGTDDGGTVTNSYWDVNATGQSTSADNATARTTDQLTGVAPLSTMSEFDFENTWQLSTSYPQLRSQGLEPVGPLAIESVEADAEVVEGRTLAVNVTVENVGDATSDGRVTLATGGETVTQSSELVLASGENRTVTLEWTPEDVSSGTHTLTVASAYDDNSTAVQVVGVGSVEDTVTDDVTGEPIAGATVTVENATYGPYEATTGADGSFALVDIPAGNYEVTIEADGYHDGTTADIVVHDDDETDLGERSLTGNASISGTVQGALFDTPLGNATVTAETSNGTYTARTAADGTYTINGVPGTGDAYVIVADADGYQTNATGYPAVTVSDGATVTGIDVALVGDATLAGTVLDARAVDTRGIDDADVRLTRTADGASVMLENATNKNGTYSRAVPGTGAGYELAFTADGYLATTEAVGNLTAGKSATVDTRLVGNATVGGTVTDDLTGEPIANATVTVDDGNLTYRAETDANGTYVVTGVPGTGGDYEVAADSVAAFRESTTTTVSVDSNRTVTADLALERVSTYVAVDEFDAPTTVDEGDGFEVTATVTNLGADRGNVTVEYVLDGTAVKSTTVSLDAGNASTVTFEYAIDDEGSYEHGLRTVNETTSTGIDVEAETSGGGNDDGNDGYDSPADDEDESDDTDPTDDTDNPDESNTRPETVTTELDAQGRATATLSVDANETVRIDLGDFVRNDAAETAITQIDLSFEDNASEVTFTADSLSELPAAVNTLQAGTGSAATTGGGDALSYFEMTVMHDGEDASERLNSATVQFTVDADRLAERGIDHEDITLYRFNENRHEWVSLESEVVSTADGRVVYNATTPGFSVFAVGEQAEMSGEPDGTTPNGSDETPTPDDSTSTEPAPSDSSTTDPGAGTTNGNGPGFGIVVAVIALVSIAFFVRRRRTQ